VSEDIVHDRRAILRLAEGRDAAPTAIILDGRAGYDGAKRRKGSKAHLAVDTLGHLLALCVTAADAQERAG